MSSDDGEFKAWERKPITNGGEYMVISEAAPVDESALAGVMRILKINKGEK